MSTKTLRKRIALTAVTALGAGLLSVVSTPAANAWSGTALLQVAPRNAENAVAVIQTTVAASRNVGVIASDTTTALAGTATMLATGTIVVGVASDTTERSISVVGGTIVGATAEVTVNAAQSSAILGTASAAKAVGIRPNAGVATMTITLNLSTSGVLSTLQSRITVTVAASNTSGVYSAANSLVNTAVSGNSTNAGVDIVNATTQSTTEIPNGGLAQVNFTLRDAFNQALPGGVLSASVTAGGLVDVVAGTSAGTPVAPVDLAGSAISTGSVTVSQAVANAPATVTVTISYNGVTVGTKTFSFQGEVTKVTVTPTKIAKTGSGQANANAATIVYNDAAGNVVYPSGSNGNVTSVVTASMGIQNIVSGVSVAEYPSDGVSGKVTVTCQATAGTVPALQVRHINAASGTAVLSNTWAQTCAGAATSLTGSWDKASYTPGSIATLTLTFKDSKGFAANSYDLLDTMTITGSPSSTTAQAGAPVTALNASAARGGGLTGTITQQYVVGSTTGDFVAVVVPPASLVTAATAAGATQGNLSLAYKIASSSATVTNEQVLASIVSLIASINKQIVALQKLILQRR
jgi:trimeric autotransporter adhesin